MKRCRACGFTKPREDFYAHRKTRDGLQAYCKACCIDKASRARSRRRGTAYVRPPVMPVQQPTVEAETPEQLRARRARGEARNADAFARLAAQTREALGL